MHIKPKVVFGILVLTGELDLDYTIIIIQTIIVYINHISRVKVIMDV